MGRKRKPELSFLNVLFCLTVIFIHIISYAVSAFPVNTVKYNLALIPWRLSAYVVQGFILLSGIKLFLTGKDTLSYGEYLKKRIKGVFLPYAVCFLVYYILFIIFLGYPIDIGQIFKRFIWGDLSCHLYFIPILLQFDLLFPVWKKITDKCSPKIIIPIALLIMQIFEYYFPMMLKGIFPETNFLYNDRVFTTYLGYWIIGCYIGKNYGSFYEFIKRRLPLISGIYAVIVAVTVYFTYIGYNGLAYIPYLNCIHNLYCLTAIIFLFGVAIRIPEGFTERISLIKQIDKSSFYIYLYHMLSLMIANELLAITGIISQAPSFIIRFVFTYTVTIFLCVVYTSKKKVR